MASTFNRYTAFNGWTPLQTLQGFMMFLGGSALRFCQRQNEEIRENLDQLQEALREAFVSPHQQFLRRQELNNRTQGPFESLETYLDDMEARASRLQLTDAETMQCFVQGLRQDLKEHVLLMLPDSYAEAVNAARLKNSLTRPKLPLSSDTAFRSPAPLGQGQTSIPSQGQINANAQVQDSRTSESAIPDSSYVTRQEFQRLQNQLSRLSQSNRPLPFDTNISPMRNRRSTDGRPICNRCNQVGHVASRCFVNLHRQNFASRGQNFNYGPHQNIQNMQQTFQNNYRSNQYAARPARFPALPQPRPPPPPPLHAFNQDCIEDHSVDKNQTCSFDAVHATESIKNTNELRKTFYLTVSGKVQGIETDILVDTRSAITVINQNLWDKIRQYSNASLGTVLGPFTTAQTTSVDIVKVLGEVDLSFVLGHTSYLLKTAVVPKLNYTAILGKDFLERFDCVIDFNAGYLKIPRDNLIFFNNAPNQSSYKHEDNYDNDYDESMGDELPFANAKPECQQTGGVSVHAADTFIIPTNSECVIPASFKEHGLAETIGLVEPNATLASRFNVCGAAALVTVSPSGLIPFRLINPTVKPVKIYRYTTLGVFSQQPDVSSVMSLEVDESLSMSDSVPPHNHEPVDWVQFDISPELEESQVQQLHEFLSNNVDVFSQGPHDLGRTSVVKHHIFTDGSAPIRQ